MMNARAMAWAWEQNARAPGTKLLLIVMASQVDHKWQCVFSASSAAAACQVSQSTVRQWLDDLRSLGLVDVEENDVHGFVVTTVKLRRAGPSRR